jgi:N-acetylneuraminic acid mutarotase
LTTQAWSTAELSEARFDIAAIGAGNKIIFGGGELGDGTSPTNVVDIYDVSTNKWTVEHLSKAGHGIAAATVGTKVLFTGGQGLYTNPARETRVDIYNLATNSWSTASLSPKIIGHVAVTANNKVYIAGGANLPGNSTSVIDIYDNETDTWSSSMLQEGKSSFAGIAVGDNIYWAGGISGNAISCNVETMNVITGRSTNQHLSGPGMWSVNSGENAVVKNGKIIFFRNDYVGYSSADDRFDIYDIASNTWSIGVLPFKIKRASIISVNNTIYLAGGVVNGVSSDKVWKLEF